mmetsp:Transcript_25987/g.58731  ORF Transcript_25987/g.58731 Transcript_25987/m.58731 type:complete len:285 (+) Transcript_25987:323-1177(+)
MHARRRARLVAQEPQQLDLEVQRQPAGLLLDQQLGAVSAPWLQRLLTLGHAHEEDAEQRRPRDRVQHRPEWKRAGAIFPGRQAEVPDDVDASRVPLPRSPLLCHVIPPARLIHRVERRVGQPHEDLVELRVRPLLQALQQEVRVDLQPDQLPPEQAHETDSHEHVFRMLLPQELTDARARASWRLDERVRLSRKVSFLDQNLRVLNRALSQRILLLLLLQTLALALCLLFLFLLFLPRLFSFLANLFFFSLVLPLLFQSFSLFFLLLLQLLSAKLLFHSRLLPL